MIEEFGGELLDCGTGTTVCGDAHGKVCLLQGGETSYQQQVSNCQAGGGVGAVVYDSFLANSGLFALDSVNGSIPAVWVSRSHGLELRGKVGASTSFGFTDQVPEESYCGAVYIGNGWVADGGTLSGKYRGKCA